MNRESVLPLNGDMNNSPSLRPLCAKNRQPSRIMKKRSKLRLIFVFTGLGYICANILFFLLNPGSSPWHYHSHNPEPIAVASEDDSNLSLVQISKILDEIDLAYGARERSAYEQARQAILRGASLVLFPATFALIIKEFVGYMGPATAKQQAFTLSVKKRYNHLVMLGLRKGMKRDGNFFVEEPSLSKRNGASFQSAGRTKHE